MTEPKAPRRDLVWVKGLRGPVAEKWGPDVTAGAIAGKVVLARHPLSAGEFSLPIAILEQRYPPPADPAP